MQKIEGFPGLTTISRHTLALISYGREEAKLSPWEVSSLLPFELATGKSSWLIFFPSASITVCLTALCQDGHFYWSSKRNVHCLQAPLSDKFSNNQAKSVREDVGFWGCQARQTTSFLWLQWHVYVLLLKALQEMMRQKPVSSGWEQLTFGNLTCVLQQRLWLIWYFEGIFVNTDTMQSVNCLQRQHWQTLLGCTLEVLSGLLKQQPSSLCPDSNCRYVAFP